MSNMPPVDCALFDVDGVLVDIRKSYNEAIRATVHGIIELIASGKLAGLSRTRADALAPLVRRKGVYGIVTDRLILRFRQTGGFNNDTDTAYAITLALLTNPAGPDGAITRRLSEMVRCLDETGIESAESFLRTRNADTDKIKEMLSYPPKKVADSPIARLFDELFYGVKLFQKQNGIEPEYVKDNGARRPAPKPMIENDRTVITEKTLKELTSLVGGNLAMVTGRSRLAAEHSLGRLINYFDIDACAFLEDEPREYSKPNPYGALRAMKRMKAKRAVYAGDSQEDLLMARRAEMQSGFLISFVGIYGLSPQPKTTAVKFRNGGALTARSVNSLPSIIRKLKVL